MPPKKSTTATTKKSTAAAAAPAHGSYIGMYLHATLSHRDRAGRIVIAGQY
jgi:histone H1/5